MYQVIIVIHVLLGLSIIGLIMMQQGKGADAGAAFGTGSAGSVFGAQGAASFLSRTTAIMAVLFFTTSLGLAVLNGQKGPAYDLMSSPSASDSGIENARVAPAKTEDLPVTPEAVTAPVTSVEQIKEVVVPKPEEIKVIEEKNAGAGKK